MSRLKKFLAFIICVSLLMSVSYIGNIAYAEETRNGVVVISDGSLNVRSEASVKATKLGTLASGDKVVIQGKDVTDAEGNIWYKIAYNTGFGYVSANYIQIVYEYVPNADFEANLTAQKFPESYKVLLRQLHAAHPNWVFLADHLSMTFDEALAEESKVGKTLVSSVAPNSQKSMEFGAYDWEKKKYAAYDTGGWVTAHKDTIAYYMEPRNFLNEPNIFLFLDQSYNSAYQNKAGLDRMLKGTFMDSAKPFPEETYKTYADVLIKAAELSKVNPYILAAMILVEQGTNGTGGSISGKVAGYEGFYNYFNINAYAKGGYNAVQYGLLYAKGTIGKAGYDRPWNTRAKSILGGAKFYGNNYVARGQNTLYYKKYNVIVPDYYINQYMTNVSGAVQEAAKLRNAYTGVGVDTMPLVFSIPVYKNTTETNTTALSTSNGANNYFLETLSVKDYKVSPTFDRYTNDYTLVVGKTVTEIEITATAPDGATVTGAGKIKLKGGKNTIPLVVTAASGKTATYTLTVHKDGVVEPETEGSSSNSTSSGISSDDSSSNSTTSGETSSTVTSSKPTSSVATSSKPTSSVATSSKPTSSVVTSSKPSVPEIKGEYNNGTNITGVAPSTKVATFIQKLKVVNGSVAVLDAAGKVKTTGTVVTGDKIQIKDSAGKITLTKNIVIYGDANADGKISIIDLAAIQMHLLEKRTMKDANLSAADVNKDGKVTIIDLAATQIHLLEKKLIKQ